MSHSFLAWNIFSSFAEVSTPSPPQPLSPHPLPSDAQWIPVGKKRSGARFFGPVDFKEIRTPQPSGCPWEKKNRLPFLVGWLTLKELEPFPTKGYRALGHWIPVLKIWRSEGSLQAASMEAPSSWLKLGGTSPAEHRRAIHRVEPRRAKRAK